MTDIAPMEVDSGAGRDKGKGKVNGATVGVDANLAKNAMWVEKYRPSSVDDLISHQDIISTRKYFKELGTSRRRRREEGSKEQVDYSHTCSHY